MTLLVRSFRPKPGRERGLIAFLQATATRMIQQQRAEAVQICRHMGTPEQIIWIESRSRERRTPASFMSGQPSDPRGEILGDALHPRPLEFLHGFYRFPLPLCGVWSLEVDPSATQIDMLKGLLDLARRAAENNDVVGISLYRALGEPTVVMGFLALRQGVTPEQLLALDSRRVPQTVALGSAIVWHPLSVEWTGGRLALGSIPLVSSSRYPRTAFWARSELLLAPSAAPLQAGEPLRVAEAAKPTG